MFFGTSSKANSSSLAEMGFSGVTVVITGRPVSQH